MNIYDVEVIENEINRIASINDGEIPEEKLRELVEAQTRSIEQIEKLCRYIRHLEQFEENAAAEIERINQLKERAQNRMESIKNYLAPYVKARGKFDAGTFTLSTRPSESVILDESFDTGNLEYNNVKVTYKPEKEKIKKDFNAGIYIQGVSIKHKNNLVIK